MSKLAGINLPMLVKLASVRNRPIAEAVRMTQEAGRKYITIASRTLTVDTAAAKEIRLRGNVSEDRSKL